MLSFIITFYLTKIVNRTKKSATQLPHDCFKSKGFISAKKADLLQKNADISKTKRVLVLKGKFSETKYVWVPTCQIRSF